MNDEYLAVYWRPDLEPDPQYQHPDGRLGRLILGVWGRPASPKEGLLGHFVRDGAEGHPKWEAAPEVSTEAGIEDSIARDFVKLVTLEERLKHENPATKESARRLLRKFSSAQRATIDEWDERLNRMRRERDAARAEVLELKSRLLHFSKELGVIASRQNHE